MSRFKTKGMGERVWGVTMSFSACSALGEPLQQVAFGLQVLVHHSLEERVGAIESAVADIARPRRHVSKRLV